MPKKYILIVGVGIVIVGTCIVCLIILGLGVVATESVRTILFSNPTTYEDYYRRASIYYDSGQYEQANTCYTKAIELDPYHAEAYYNRGNTFVFLGEYEKAIADYTKTTKLDPQHANAWGYLCWFGSLQGHARDVMDACERGVELDPDNGGIRDSRGLARALTGDYKGAIEDFKLYVIWSKENGRYQSRGFKREEWITELEAGRNPFNEATLQELLAE